MSEQRSDDLAASVSSWLSHGLLWSIGLALLYLLSMGPYFKISHDVYIPAFYEMADRLWCIRSPYNVYARYMSLWGFTRA